MALPRSLFTADVSTEVQMPEPLSCIFHIRPLRPLLAAEHQKRQGLTLEGFAQAEGRQTIQASFDPLKQIQANLWLAREIVTGWDGLRTDDGELVPFSREALERVASNAQCWSLIYAEAEKLAGARVAEESGN